MIHAYKPVTERTCYDCDFPIVETDTHYGNNVSRCLDCAELFAEKLHFERLWKFRAERTAAEKHRCGEEIPGANDSCEECCEHGDCDDHGCLDCGKDLMESRMGYAYDLYKDSMRGRYDAV